MPWRDAGATIVLAIATAVASLLVFATGELSYAAVGGGFIPLRFEPEFGAVHDFPIPALLTPLTATLIHGGMTHLLLNLLMLLFCGVAVERVLGARGVVVLYLVGAYAAAIGHALLESNGALPMIGASGAISALVGAYALLYGRRRAKPIGPLSGEVVHVAWLAAAWIGIQLLVGVAGVGGMGAIAIGAHIGGFLAGLALARPLLAWRWRGA